MKRFVLFLFVLFVFMGFVVCEPTSSPGSFYKTGDAYVSGDNATLKVTLDLSDTENSLISVGFSKEAINDYVEPSSDKVLSNLSLTVKEGNEIASNGYNEETHTSDLYVYYQVRHNGGLNIKLSADANMKDGSELLPWTITYYDGSSSNNLNVSLLEKTSTSWYKAVKSFPVKIETDSIVGKSSTASYEGTLTVTVTDPS